MWWRRQQRVPRDSPARGCRPSRRAPDRSCSCHCARTAPCGLSDDFIALLRERSESGPNPPLQQVIGGERLIEFSDAAESEFYHSRDPLAKAAIAAGVRNLIWVALVRERVAVGVFVIGRCEVGPFSTSRSRRFDDLLISSFMKTTLHGVESPYPGFSPIVPKYADNGQANTRYEVARYMLDYIMRAPGDMLNTISGRGPRRCLGA